MHVKSVSQGPTSNWSSQYSNPGPPDPEALCLPLDHDATTSRKKPPGMKSLEQPLS